MASYPALEDWFSASIRRNRKSFMLATGSLIIVMLVVAGVVTWFGGNDLIILVFAIAVCICSYMLTAQRLRDMGLTGWLTLLWIPVNLADAYLHGAATLAAWIVLCVVPGTQGPNRYGLDPIRAD